MTLSTPSARRQDMPASRKRAINEQVQASFEALAKGLATIDELVLQIV